MDLRKVPKFISLEILDQNNVILVLIKNSLKKIQIEFNHNYLLMI